MIADEISDDVIAPCRIVGQLRQRLLRSLFSHVGYEGAANGQRGIEESRARAVVVFPQDVGPPREGEVRLNAG